MSEAIAGITINNETLVFIDFDRPVWKNIHFPSNRCIPKLENFVVDGILGAASKENLESLNLSTKYIGKDFSDISPSVELDSARKEIYDCTSLAIEYFHPMNSDIHIERDLAKFLSKIVITQVSESEFIKMIKQK
jgi:hypothetical protein